MNKLILFPLAFLILLTIFSNTFNAPTSTNTTTDVPHAGQRWFDLGSPASILLILTVAITVGCISGFTFLGSGFSDFSQNLMFNFAVFMGIWISLTIIASDWLFSNTIFSIFYLLITFMYVLGIGMMVNSTGG